MILNHPKYKFGDKVYMMHGNKVHHGKIVSIKICETTIGEYGDHLLEVPNYEYGVTVYGSHHVFFRPKEIFTSQEELIEAVKIPS